jgi:23S rRNA (pseudouridine1915-N3)-methyltransferase
MRLTLAAVGRLRSGPEKALAEDYLLRAERTGRPLGLAPVTLVEVEDRKGGGKASEAAALARAVPPGARLVALDERGRQMDSPGFAAELARWRDAGVPEAVFLIGGADGLDPALVGRADLVLSFGAMVWPHLLVRAMLAEQIYRAATILAGGPYHRV